MMDLQTGSWAFHAARRAHSRVEHERELCRRWDYTQRTSLLAGWRAVGLAAEATEPCIGLGQGRIAVVADAKARLVLGANGPRH